MIEVIEVIWGSAGRVACFGAAPVGGRVGDMLNLGPLGSGVGYGFSLWFEGFGEIVSPQFRTRLTQSFQSPAVFAK